MFCVFYNLRVEINFNIKILILDFLNKMLLVIFIYVFLLFIYEY